MLNPFIDANETILWQGKPSRLLYTLGHPFIYPFSLIWGIFDYAFYTRTAGTFDLFLLVHAAPVWYALFSPIYRYFNWLRIEYALTDKRIYITGGLIGLDIASVELPEVQGLSVNVGVLETPLRRGTIYFSRGRLRAIDHPYEVYKLIQRTALDITTDRQFPNKLRPDENDGYHTRYKGTP